MRCRGALAEYLANRLVFGVASHRCGDRTPGGMAVRRSGTVAVIRALARAKRADVSLLRVF